MPTKVPLDDLRKAQDDIAAFKMKHPEAFEDMAKMLREHRSAGYKNFCRLFMGETTPEELTK